MKSLLAAFMVLAFSGVAGAQVAYAPFRLVQDAGAWADTFGPCTSGTDCFCDLIDTAGTTANGPYSDVVFCLDVDHDAFYSSTPTDPGGYGNWVAGSGGDRGVDNIWTGLYGGTDFGATWTNGQPGTPTLGANCSVSVCSGKLEYDITDRWQANSEEPWVDIVHTAADWTSNENASAAPTIPGSSGAVVFGDNSYGMRNPRNTEGGDAHTGGYQTDTDLVSGGTHAKLGMTQAMTFEDNVSASGVLGDNWKFDEFNGSRRSAGASRGDDGLIGFRSTGYNDAEGHGLPLTAFPFHSIIFAATSGGAFDCPNAAGGATETLGDVFCSNGDLFMYIYAEPGIYTWPGDFDLTEWHCVSWYWDFTAISSVSVKAWIDGTNVIDITGIDLTGSFYDATSGTDGWHYFTMNNYANKSSSAVGSPPLAESTRRFVDNYVIRDNTPVLCEDVGFPSSYNQTGL